MCIEGARMPAFEAYVEPSWLLASEGQVVVKDNLGATGPRG